MDAPLLIKNVYTDTYLSTFNTALLYTITIKCFIPSYFYHAKFIVDLL